MTRVFLKLYLLLVLPLFIMVLLPQSPLSILSSWWTEKVAFKRYRAIYPLVKEELDGLPQERWKDKINQLSTHFAYLLELKEPEETKLNKEVLKKLADKGFTATTYKQNYTLIFKVEDSNFLLFASLNSNSSDLEEFEKDTRGFRYFLNKKNRDAKNPQQELERMKTLFSIDLTLTKMSDFIETNKGEIVETLKEKHLYLDDSNNINKSYILSDNEEYLITIEANNYRQEFRYYFRYLSFIIPALLLAMGVLIWLYLFRKELNTLKSAAKTLGSGQLNTRISLSKNSSLFPISDSFNDMATRIQVLLEDHKDLTNAVSHELKTPLSRLHFALEMQKTSKNEKDREIYTQKIEDNILSLENLVDELLSYTRMQRQQTINLKEQSLSNWLEHEITTFRDYHPAVDISTNFIGEKNRKKEVAFDAHLMSRALDNLLSNAAHYANSKSPIINVMVKVGLDEVALSVEDNGDGISPDNCTKIFEPFTRLDKSRQRKNNKNMGGYGMGLAIVKRILSQHNGDVSCTGSKLGGAKITLCWPRL